MIYTVKTVLSFDPCCMLNCSSSYVLTLGEPLIHIGNGPCPSRASCFHGDREKHLPHRFMLTSQGLIILMHEGTFARVVNA